MTQAVSSNTVSMSMTNPAVPGDPVVIYQGVAAQLAIVLTNQTGADIALNPQSTLQVYLPPYFTAAQVAQMNITGISPPGWIAGFDSSGPNWVLKWAGATGTWSDGDVLGLTLANVVCTAPPQTDTVQINLSGFVGSNIPLSVSDPLAVAAAPVPGHANLHDVLSVEAIYGGAVYISSGNVPLVNTVYLNLKNTGTTPLYNGTGANRGTPKITVSFVYGTTSGALAPDDKKHAADPGSAWTIVGSVDIDQTDKWFVRNPNPTDQANSPFWTLKPVSTNLALIGTGAHANVTFAFGHLISFTPPGATQMFVQFSGFMKDDSTPYDDTVYVVGLNKQTAPNPGVIGIFSRAESIPVSSESAAVPIPLTWSMFGVGSVRLQFYVADVPDLKPVEIRYGTGKAALTYDTQAPTITGIKSTQLLTVYCWAYSDNNFQNLLNKVQCTVPLIFPPAIKSFTIQPIKIVPPFSYSFQLDWEIAGATSYQITADEGHGPQLVPVPQGVTSYVVHPASAQTIYTLTAYGTATLNY